MINAILVILDVAIEHGGVGTQADLVSNPRGIQPLVAVNLVIADDVADTIGKDLRAAARAGIDSRFLQLQQRVANAELRTLRQESDLYHGEGF